MLSKVQCITACATKTVTNIAHQVIYYGKVGAELSKHVYIKEGLQPPNWSDFRLVYTKLYKQALSLSTRPNDFCTVLKNLQKNDVIKYGSYGIQFLGLYSLGEIIGRRKVVGYNNYSVHH